MVNKQTKNQQPTLDHQKQLPRTIHIPETNPPFWPYVHDQRPTRFASYNAYPWKRQNKRSKHSEWKNGLIAMRHEADDPFRVQSFPPLLLARRYAHFRLLPISREAQISSVCLRFHSKTHYYYYGGTRLGPGVALMSRFFCVWPFSRLLWHTTYHTPRDMGALFCVCESENAFTTLLQK